MLMSPFAITKDHPHRQSCKVCGGTGEITEYENGAPFGEGYWSMPVVNVCNCLDSGHCPICYTHLMPRPWLHHLSQYMFYVADKIGNRYYRFGVLVCAWKGNVRRKLMAEAEHLATELGYYFRDWSGDCAGECPLCHHKWEE